MTETLNRPLYWHQDMFPQPHHFQYQDAWAASNLARAFDLIVPWGWGFSALQINEAELAANTFLVDRLTIRWRDGTLTDYPGNAGVAPKHLNPAEFAHGPRTLYVGLRRHMGHGQDVTSYGNLTDALHADTRLAVPAEPQQVPDRYAHEPQGRVTFMTYVLRLFWEDELDQFTQYDLIPIAQFVQDGDQVRLSPHFIPPCLTLAASTTLQQMLHCLRDEVVGRARQLEVFKRSSVSRAEDMQCRPVLALSILNRYGAAIAHLTDSMQTDPWTAYGVLRQLAGELSTFSEYCNLLGETHDKQVLVPAYRHTDIGGAYVAVTALIRRLLTRLP